VARDPLEDYRQKRDASATPEPGGEAIADGGGQAPRFVVQEHHARRLHWDLRLERDGVLASWAVPRGIPTRPDQNHLAVHTEDHPLEYLTFHGDIPKGQYGAGSMTVWDTGTYETHKWREEEVMITFHGERVRGRYVLFRTRENDWMLHRMDPPDDLDEEPLPEKVSPMLARLGTLPEGDDWAYEVKWDGVRALCWVEGGRIRLESRNGRDVTAGYPEIRGLGEALGARPALLDGEIVAWDENGRPSFGRLQGRMHVTNDAAIRRRVKDTPVAYLIFDVLHLDGKNLMPRPWEERRSILESLALEGPAWRVPDVRRGDGAELLEVTKARGLEGVIAKQVSCPYEPGRRTGHWIKVKNLSRQELVVGGWLPGEGKRRHTIGALLVGYHEGEELRFAGRVGTGFTEAELLRLEKLFKPLEQAERPFSDGQIPKTAVWLKPCLVAEVEYTEWTSGGMIRHPSYKGLRDDLDPEHVVREGTEPEVEDPEPVVEAPKAKPRRAAGEVEVEGRRLKVSNLEKVLYPEAGFTKGQVLDFYVRVSPALLPHLRDRPLTLKRYPNGVHDKFFYEKNSPSHGPEWVTTRRIGDIDFTICDDLPTLMWVANLASLELHTSLSRDPVERPTMLVFDLDPGPPADIVLCCRVGLRIREVLGELGLESVAKTSGSKGLQVYAPLNVEGITYADTKPFARAVAELLERRFPDDIVSRMTKSIRGGKVLVDWSQNDQHKTTVSVYSLRARERPTVSTPVTWDEVEGCLEAEDPDLLRFETGAVVERITEHGDLFAPTLEREQPLPELGRRRR
jgi:bifunctional non-homologous end joining protein LigD